MVDVFQHLAKSKPSKKENMNLFQKREMMHLINYVAKKAEEEKECTFHPKINHNSREIMKNSPTRSLSNMTLYERLHRLNEEKQIVRGQMEMQYKQK